MDNNNFGSDVTGSDSSVDNAATSQGYTGSDIGSNIPEGYTSPDTSIPQGYTSPDTSMPQNSTNQDTDSTAWNYTTPDVSSISEEYAGKSSTSGGYNSGYTDNSSTTGSYNSTYTDNRSNNTYKTGSSSPNGSYTGSNSGYNYNPGSSSDGNGDIPGRGAATASLVLGIISIVCWVFTATSFIGLITGIIGLICSSSAKKAGFKGGIQTAGFVCSLIGVIGGAIVLVACVVCVGILGTMGAIGEL